jgi:hypothetical protein
VKLPTMPNLEGLIRLAHQDGIDVRPTLIRVLTDMYVQKEGHTRDEERRFVELATWLLATVDTPTRAAVAKKLAVYPEAPRAVVRRLAVDEFEVAEPVLRHSPALTSEDLLTVTIECGWQHAAAIASRELRAEPVAAIAPPEANDLFSASAFGATVADEPAATADVTTSVETASAAPAQSVMVVAPEVAVEFSWSPIPVPEPPAAESTPQISTGRRFLIGSAEERRAILAGLDDAPATNATQFPTPTPEAIAQLEAAALAERPDDFARDLQNLLLLSRETAQEIVDDNRGEPVMIAARALGMPGQVLLRILLFLNPTVGRSVERVFDLMDHFTRVTPEAARSLVAGWREPRIGERRSARYQPALWDDESAARRGGTDFGRRGVQVPEGRTQPSRGTESANQERRQRTT